MYDRRLMLCLFPFQAFFNFAKVECLHEISKVSMDEAVKQTTQSNESWKKLQEHTSNLEARDATLTNEIFDLLK